MNEVHGAPPDLLRILYFTRYFLSAMKYIYQNIAAILVVAAALTLPAAASGMEASEAISIKIVRYAAANGLNRIVMDGFTAEMGAQAAEADYIAGRLTAFLAGNKTPTLIDRPFFERVLREARAAGAAKTGPEGMKQFKTILVVDALIAGTVQAAGDKLQIMVRLIDAKTGALLFVTAGEAEREWLKPPKIRTARHRSGIFTINPEIPGILVPDGFSGTKAEPLASLPDDFRDAVSDFQSQHDTDEPGSCAVRRRRLSRLNADLVDAKAGYWAYKMKEPGSSFPGLGENPGSEIDEPGTKIRFYKQLAAYYKARPTPVPAPVVLSKVLSLIAEERQFADDCEIP